jgi:hypothetical protein
MGGTTPSFKLAALAGVGITIEDAAVAPNAKTNSTTLLERPRNKLDIKTHLLPINLFEITQS